MTNDLIPLPAGFGSEFLVLGSELNNLKPQTSNLKLQTSNLEPPLSTHSC
jgi:hypothetical protein